MSYLEIVQLALKGRSVNAAAKAWGVPQPTLDQYIKLKLLPNYKTAVNMAKDAGISAEEMLNTLVQEEENRKQKTKLSEKISANFDYLMSRLTPRRSFLPA